MGVHDVAEQGFGDDPANYDRARPGYPSDALTWLADQLRLHAGTTVLDLAAGTGKLTRPLTTTGATVLAAEPVAGMREVLAEATPTVPIVGAVAESLPFADGTLDAVTVAQAFHWFDTERAAHEIARALRTGARLGLIWNARDRSTDWADRVWAIMDRVEKRAPWRDHDGIRDAAGEQLPGFGPLHEATFHHTQASTPDGVVARVASVSHVAVLADDERTGVLDEVATLLATHPDTTGHDHLDVPYRVDAFWCERA